MRQRRTRHAGQCFNEAAGIPRGRRFKVIPLSSHATASMRPRVFPAEDLDDNRLFDRDELASMRPRVFPAEDAGSGEASRSRPACFNEAAGIPRGRREYFEKKQTCVRLLQ